MQAGVATDKYLVNPVSCITAGSAVIFEGITDESYPVYDTKSLLNSNPDYDYGEFFNLGK